MQLKKVAVISAWAVALCDISLDAAADVKFEPSLKVGGTYVDNITLLPHSVTPKDAEWIGEATPQLSIRQSSVRMKSALEYSMQNLFFSEHKDLNATNHLGEANGSLTVVNDLLYVDGYGSMSQGVIDLSGATDFNNLLVTNNKVKVVDAQISPYLRHDIGWVTGLLRYRTGVSRYHIPGGQDLSTVDTSNLEDSDTNMWLAQLGSTSQEDKFVWQVSGERNAVDYVVSGPYRFDRASATAEYGISNTFWFTGQGGYETNLLEGIGDGGLDHGFWYAGFRWQTNEDNRFEARYGHRFFGRAYGAKLTRTARQLRFMASYSEDPASGADSELGFDFVPGEIEVNQPRTFMERRSADPFLRKVADVSLTLTGIRTEIFLRGSHTKREYIQLGTRDVLSSVDLSISRRLNSTNRLTLIGTYEAGELRDFTDLKDTIGTLTYVHLWSAKFESTLRVSHMHRDGVADYDVNIASLFFTKKF